ncbi:hypothetical protein BO94DRAFT_540175 [Aspergillus sclerotioniger CBS 115572]|uniref:Uncharacterized protein n=1 Tax=Aspergillus sclerotioniger CBS 115572 TaxID=1450535 RepID=A0A317V2I3_9EURO|nr:hypothetical protein BO94DRAFT_540175 [Aspergillus sclerotioniger CBS 115572]PWY68493.1 hypothetical protein BO94DRAFT_540175 [Aspergillus sclerotioniger CBS 115572]
MPPSKTTTRLLILLTPPALLTYTTHRYLSTLEAKYPPVDPTTTTSLALRTPSSPTQHCPEIDVYEARAVPVKSLLKRYKHILQINGQSQLITAEDNPPKNEKERRKETLTKSWTLTFLNTAPLLHEASIFGLFLNRSYSPGDTGLTTLTSTPTTKKGERLLNGIFTIESFTPSHSPSTPNTLPGLILSWSIPPEPILFFEKMAKWGYPFRLMSGGRHEIGISPVYIHEGEEVVDVRFASAHDYEVLESEGGLESQKMIPKWTGRLHRGYARFLLHSAIQDLEI